MHVSGREAIEQIAWAQGKGLQVYGETCPQYLFLTAQDLDRDGFEGAKYMCSPPPRDAANQAHVWRGLQSGVLEVFSSDHAPYRYRDPGGKHAAGENPPFHQVANGVPGLEIRLPMLFSEGVGGGRLTLQQFVDLTATRAARLYGLYPRKGTIAVGSDADIAIWEPRREVTIGQHLCMQAGAYQNACWVAGVAKAGDEDGHALMAGSCIINPDGEIVALTETREDEIIVHDCDLEACAFLKQTTFNFEAHRRTEHYGLICSQTGTVPPPE